MDPAHRVTPIYQFPSDLSIMADPGDAIPLLLDEVRSQLTGVREAEITGRRETAEASSGASSSSRGPSGTAQPT